jgi:uncharacterized protein (TIGR02246 family)
MNDEQAIRDLVATWLSASAAGDHARVLELMADDVVFLTVNNPPMRGKAAFKAAQAGLGKSRIDAASDIQEIRVFGNRAVMWNKLSVTITPPGGKPVRHAGDVLTVLVKQADGRWVVERDANLLTAIAD